MNFPASKWGNAVRGAPGGMFPPDLNRIKSYTITLSIETLNSSLKMSNAEKLVYFFSLILLTFPPGKINIQRAKTIGRTRNRFLSKYFLQYLCDYEISFSPILTVKKLAGLENVSPSCPVIPFISPAILNCYSLPRITPSTPVKLVEAF